MQKATICGFLKWIATNTLGKGVNTWRMTKRVLVNFLFPFFLSPSSDHRAGKTREIKSGIISKISKTFCLSSQKTRKKRLIAQTVGENSLLTLFFLLVLLKGSFIPEPSSYDKTMEIQAVKPPWEQFSPWWRDQEKNMSGILSLATLPRADSVLQNCVMEEETEILRETYLCRHKNWERASSGFLRREMKKQIPTTVFDITQNLGSLLSCTFVECIPQIDNSKNFDN